MPIRKYPPELKERAVRLCRESTDRPLSQTAGRLGINCETLRNWAQQDRHDRGATAQDLSTAERERLRELELP